MNDLINQAAQLAAERLNKIEWQLADGEQNPIVQQLINDREAMKEITVNGQATAVFGQATAVFGHVKK